MNTLMWTCIFVFLQFGIACGRYLFVPMDRRISATGEMKQDWCTAEGAFKNILDVTLYKCGEECMRRTRCRSVLYNAQLRFCRLRHEQDVTPTSTENLHKICISSDILTWDISVIGNCALRPCDENSRCYLNKQLSYRCEKTECHDLPAVANSHAASIISDIGSTNAYICNEPYTRVGESYAVTCDRNGEWSTPSFTCYRRCAFSPKFDKAIVSPASPRVYVASATLEYVCQNGYHREDGADHHKLVCDENGDWSNPKCVTDNNSNYIE